MYDVDFLNRINWNKKLSEGSTCNIFEIEGNKYIAKCSKHNKFYKSFNLQKQTYQICNQVFIEGDIVVPQMIYFMQDEKIGDIMVLERIDNLYSIDFIINNGIYYGDLIIKKIAKAMALLHNSGISGYDIEVYWNPIENSLVLLDIGPMYTFGFTSMEMLKFQWDMEKNNPIGRWNIISEIVDRKIVEQISDITQIENISFDLVLKYLREDASVLHIENVAAVHGINFIGTLEQANRKKYLNIFIDEYKKFCIANKYYVARYIRSFAVVLQKENNSAQASLYYSIASPLCQENCRARML